MLLARAFLRRCQFTSLMVKYTKRVDVRRKESRAKMEMAINPPRRLAGSGEMLPFSGWVLMYSFAAAMVLGFCLH
jgi:hypothetical protein